jgi:predicted dehydrogenase
MIDQFREVAEFCKLEIPITHRIPIAIVGAGGIVDGAHLPAYAKAGLEVVGITDVDMAKATDVAKRHNIPNVYTNLDELLSDPMAQVIDIAVPSVAQPAIFAKVASAGRNILAQKPMAPTVAAGIAMADSVDANGIVAGVNHQLRFEEGVAAAYKMVDMGWIGTVTNMSITVNLVTPWELWSWAKELDRLEIMLHSIHYHDLMRWFLGDPHTVFCALRASFRKVRLARSLLTCTTMVSLRSCTPIM